MSKNELAAISAVARENALSVIQGLDEVEGAFRLAGAIAQLQAMIDGPRCKQLAALAGSKLGFLCDKEYTAAQLRDPAIECLLRGGRWVGNEFNVIAGNCYMTLQYYERIVGELVTNLDIQMQVPASVSDGALVACRATWTCDGVPHCIECSKRPDGDFRIPVRVNKGMGIDAILGKARRKLLAAIYRRVTGSAWALDDAAADTISAPAVGQAEVTAQLPPAPAESAEFERDRILQTATDTLPNCPDITAVNALQAHLGELLDQDDLECWDALSAACEGRKEEIRASRGGRANGG